MQFDEFTIERDGTIVGTSGGFFYGDPNESKIQLMSNVDVRDGDWIIHDATKRRYFAEKTEPVSANGIIRCWIIKYQSETEYNAEQKKHETIFNIQNAYGSVIGTGNQATINYNSEISELKQAVSTDTSADKEQLEKIVSLLEMVVNDQVPPSKGLFSKFSDVLERHSWLSSSVAGTILSWLMTKIQ